MTRKRSRLLSCAMCVLMIFAVFTAGYGCKRDNRDVDTSKSQLYIGYFGGGYGTKYMEDLKSRFEEYYKDTSFEEGKTGVEVWAMEDKDRYATNALYQNILEEENEIFMTGFGENYNKYIDDMKKGNQKLLDITDAITEPLTEYGETKSIADKMPEQVKNFLLRDGKYYGIPYVGPGANGLVYNGEVFDEYTLYFAKGGCPSEFCEFTQSNNTNKATGKTASDFRALSDYGWTNEAGEKSAGPDGKYGTFDDGFAATLDEFEIVVERMSVQGVDSIIWTGQYADTYSSFLNNQFNYAYNGEGMLTRADGGGADGRIMPIVTGFDSEDDPIIKNAVVGLNALGDNGQRKDTYPLMMRSAGMYFGSKMFDIMLESGTVSKKVPQQLSNVRTQEAFMISNLRDGETPIALMMEGSWWEAEAETAGIFRDNELEFGEAGKKENRNFGLYPLPKAYTSLIGTAYCVSNTYNEFIARANVAPSKVELVKTFIRFANTEESLRRWNVNTALPGAMSYELTDADRAQLSKFSAGLYDYVHNATVIYPLQDPALVNDPTMSALKNILLYNWSDASDSSYLQDCYEEVSLKQFFDGIYHNGITESFSGKYNPVFSESDYLGFIKDQIIYK